MPSRKSTIIPHQTVGWWIEQLKEFDPKLPVVLFDGPGANSALFCLSTYEMEINQKIVAIDVGPNDG